MGIISARTRMVFAGLPLLLAAVLVGCGGGSSTNASTPTAAVPSSPATATPVSAASVDAVAYVASTPIPKSSYSHWLAVETNLGGATNAGHRALAFLLTSQWMLGEANARRISVSEAEVKQRYSQLVGQSFPKASELEKYFATSGETEADLLVRIKVELLTARIAAQVSAGKSGSQRSTVLAEFQNNFHVHWKALTNCKPGYVMEDCRQYKGKRENLSAPTKPSAVPGTSSSVHSSSKSAPASVSGEVYSKPGGFTLTSPAFERNGPVPAEYMCSGAGRSPALSWSNVPAHAAELFLFVIDDDNNGSSGGIRWVVGGIDPKSSGVAAGQLPAGAIVGTNTAGKASYSPICPPHGKSDTIELVLYALSKKLSISPGFQAPAAEAQYGQHKLILGQAAVTYGIATG